MSFASNFAKLEQREIDARRKITKAEKSYRHAFRDELTADLRRGMSFSLASLRSGVAPGTGPTAAGAQREPKEEHTLTERIQSFHKAASFSRRTGRQTRFADEVSNSPESSASSSLSSAPLSPSSADATKAPAAKDRNKAVAASRAARGGQRPDADEDAPSTAPFTVPGMPSLRSAPQSPSSQEPEMGRQALRGPADQGSAAHASSLSGKHSARGAGSPVTAAAQESSLVSLDGPERASGPSESREHTTGRREEQRDELSDDGRAQRPRQAASFRKSAPAGPASPALDRVKNVIRTTCQLNESTPYGLTLRNFVDAVLSVGTLAAAEHSVESRRDSAVSTRPPSTQPCGTACAPSVWRSPLFLESLATHVDQIAAYTEGGPIKERQEVATLSVLAPDAVWVSLHDACVALLDSFRAARSAAPPSASPPAEEGDSSATDEEWARQFALCGLLPLQRCGSMPLARTVTGAFDLLSGRRRTAPRGAPARRENAPGGVARTSVAEYRQFDQRLVPYALVKAVLLDQAEKTVSREALTRETSVDYFSDDMQSDGVPLVPFAMLVDWLRTAATPRFTVGELERYVAPLVVPEVFRRFLPLARPASSACNVSMSFVHRGADCLAAAVYARDNLVAAQKICQRSLVAHRSYTEQHSTLAGGGEQPHAQQLVLDDFAGLNERQRAELLAAATKTFLRVLTATGTLAKKQTATRCLLLLVLYGLSLEEGVCATTAGLQPVGAEAAVEGMAESWHLRIFSTALSFFTLLELLEKWEAAKDSGEEENAPFVTPSGTVKNPRDALNDACAEVCTLFYDFFVCVCGGAADAGGCDPVSCLSAGHAVSREQVRVLHTKIHAYRTDKDDSDEDGDISPENRVTDEAPSRKGTAAGSPTTTAGGGATVTQLRATEGDEERRPVDADVPYKCYPDGTESLSVVCAALSSSLGLSWLCYSTELDGVVTFCSSAFFADGSGLDESLVAQLSPATAAAEHKTEVQRVHVSTFNAMMEAVMTHLQCAWVGVRWMRSLAATTLEKATFDVLRPTVLIPKHTLARKLRTAGRNPYPANFGAYAHQLAESVAALWPYGQRERGVCCPMPAKLVAKKRCGSAFATSATQAPSRRTDGPSAGAFSRHQSFNSFASVVRPMTGNGVPGADSMTSRPSSAVGGMGARTRSLKSLLLGLNRPTDEGNQRQQPQRTTRVRAVHSAESARHVALSPTQLYALSNALSPSSGDLMHVQGIPSTLSGQSLLQLTQASLTTLHDPMHALAETESPCASQKQQLNPRAQLMSPSVNAARRAASDPSTHFTRKAVGASSYNMKAGATELRPMEVLNSPSAAPPQESDDDEIVPFQGAATARGKRSSPKAADSSSRRRLQQPRNAASMQSRVVQAAPRSGPRDAPTTGASAESRLAAATMADTTSNAGAGAAEQMNQSPKQQQQRVGKRAARTGKGAAREADATARWDVVRGKTDLASQSNLSVYEM